MNDERELYDVLRTGEADRPPEGLTLEEVPSDDPDVARRWESADERRPRQVVTAYRPRFAAPVSYPRALPFVPAVRVFVTEMADRPGQPGARWLVEDDSDVVSDVLSALVEDGWTEAPDRELGFPFPGMSVVLTRRDQARLLLEVRLDENRRVVQLLPLV